MKVKIVKAWIEDCPDDADVIVLDEDGYIHIVEEVYTSRDKLILEVS